MTNEEFDELLEEVDSHLNNGRFKMALTAANKVYDQKPYDANAIIYLAWANLENGNLNQALELSNLAVQISDDDITSKLYRGYFLMRMSIYEGALSDLTYVINNNTDKLKWAYLNKARALAGLERYFEGLEEIEKALEINSEENLFKKLTYVKGLFKIVLGYDDDVFKVEKSEIKSFLPFAESAFKEKEFWFTHWAANQIINNQDLTHEHQHAKLLELETLASMFQIRAASAKISEYRDDLADNFRFQNICSKINSFSSLENFSIEGRNELDKMYSLTSNSGLKIFENKLFKIYTAKTFDYLEFLQTEKKVFLLQFNTEMIRYIGVEVSIDNPFFGNKDMIVEGSIVWYLNGDEIGTHPFSLELIKEEKVVKFVESWGSDSKGFWKSGTGYVDVYLDFYKVCSSSFMIGDYEIINFEEDENFAAKTEKIKSHPGSSQTVFQASKNEAENHSIDDLLSILNSYVGLDSIKQPLKDFVDYLKFLNERKKLGLKTQEQISFHCVFLGNPGTGKTTVARLLGKILKEIEFVKSGHVIEVDRSMLVGQYVGETAQKTDKIIKEAIGGILFIDEAYTLKKEGSGQDFGQEAIDLLLKRMEDESNNFVVITAGYPEEMNNFINSNPGLKSRFTHFFEFDDYNPDELVVIFKQFAAKEDYSITDDAAELLKKEFTQLYRKRDKSFGNARLVKNLFNDAKIQLGKRYLKLKGTDKSKDKMTTITLEDIAAVIDSSKSKLFDLEIDEALLSKALAKLNNMIGLELVKKEINEIVKLARLHKEGDDNLQELFSSHFLFMGNPGTGKTTVARLFSEIYSALGILPKGHLIETDRQGLVGSYVGQTAQKTSTIIDKSIGGTLFIDEAYSLVKKGHSSESDFGAEAIDTLLKRMEDDRGKFIVIAAGYTDEMNNFINSNPGLESRFSKKLFFEDYSPQELLTITTNYFSEKSYSLDDEAKEQLLNYFISVYKNRGKNFGNARLVRSLVEDSIKNHFLQLADNVNSNQNKNSKTITVKEIREFISSEENKEEVKPKANPELLDKYLNELSNLTGLDSVKKTIHKLVSSLKVAKMREERGLKVIPKNLHSIFLANPGTGKTTILRLLSKVYKEMGLLSKGHLVEIDRTALIGTYQGHTAEKTQSIIEQAVGGILLINDVPAVSKGYSEYGQEFVNTLLTNLENNNNDLVVILSGYSDEMKVFLETYPLLKNSFTNYFTFDDYTPRQMLEIALSITNKNGYQLDEGAWQRLLDIFTNLYSSRDKNFGNARTVKNILYKSISNQEERVLTLYNLKDEDLSTITFEDVNQIDVNEI